MTTIKLDEVLPVLKSDLLNMMQLVNSQVYKSKEALNSFDKNMALEVLSIEKRVDAYELKIDIDCENILALYAPVAIDLRFILATYTINSDLERIGDKAASIARHVNDMDAPFETSILQKLRIDEMFTHALNIIDITHQALEKEDTNLARMIFNEDKLLNVIHRTSMDVGLELIHNDINNAKQVIYANSIIKKIERIGDLAKSIAEEIIFYIEAKVVKHSKLKG
jgi:phosphate transport system protein